LTDEAGYNGQVSALFRGRERAIDTQTHFFSNRQVKATL